MAFPKLVHANNSDNFEILIPGNNSEAYFRQNDNNTIGFGLPLYSQGLHAYGKILLNYNVFVTISSGVFKKSPAIHSLKNWR